MKELGEILRLSTDYLARHGVPSPRLDAELLLGHALGLDRLQLYLNFDRPVTPEEAERARALLRRRARREPLAWITGVREFYGRDFRVEPGLLVPRPETETLVEVALELIPRGEGPVYVADVGTGTGCLAVTLAAEREDFRVYATDLDPAALRCARENARAHGVQERVGFLRGDLLDAVPRERPVDWLVSNPPYVPTAELAGLSPEVRHEPRLALDGGPDGLAPHRRLLEQARRRGLRGALLEIGHGQGARALELARARGYRAELRRDLGGRERVLVALRTGGGAG